jgi:hypothetical protein
MLGTGAAAQHGAAAASNHAENAECVAAFREKRKPEVYRALSARPYSAAIDFIG